jgi:hypothetical protein
MELLLSALNCCANYCVIGSRATIEDRNDRYTNTKYHTFLEDSGCENALGN